VIYKTSPNQPQQKLNEHKPNKQADILLTEDPIGGVVILE
jgi:hypothetical protein